MKAVLYFVAMSLVNVDLFARSQEYNQSTNNFYEADFNSSTTIRTAKETSPVEKPIRTGLTDINRKLIPGLSMLFKQYPIMKLLNKDETRNSSSNTHYSHHAIIDNINNLTPGKQSRKITIEEHYNVNRPNNTKVGVPNNLVETLTMENGKPKRGDTVSFDLLAENINKTVKGKAISNEQLSYVRKGSVPLINLPERSMVVDNNPMKYLINNVTNVSGVKSVNEVSNTTLQLVSNARGLPDLAMPRSVKNTEVSPRPMSTTGTALTLDNPGLSINKNLDFRPDILERLGQEQRAFQQNDSRLLTSHVNHSRIIPDPTPTIHKNNHPSDLRKSKNVMTEMNSVQNNEFNNPIMTRTRAMTTSDRRQLIRNLIARHNMELQRLGANPFIHNTVSRPNEQSINTESQTFNQHVNLMSAPRNQQISLSNMQNRNFIGPIGNNPNQRTNNQILQPLQANIFASRVARPQFTNGDMSFNRVNQQFGVNNPSNSIGTQVPQFGRSIVNQNLRRPINSIINALPAQNSAPFNHNQHNTALSQWQLRQRLHQSRILEGSQRSLLGNSNTGGPSTPVNQINTGVMRSTFSRPNVIPQQNLGQSQQRDLSVLQNIRSRNAFGRLLQSIELPKDPNTGQAIPILIYPVGLNNDTSRTQVSAVNPQIANAISQVLSRPVVRHSFPSNINSLVPTRASFPAQRIIPNQPLVSNPIFSSNSINRNQQWTAGQRSGQAFVGRSPFGQIQSAVPVQRQHPSMAMQNFPRQSFSRGPINFGNHGLPVPVAA